jgi:hypothetical protein
MAEWIYLLHPPRDNFAATMTDQETARAIIAGDPVNQGGWDQVRR